jgi:hypothetical protein
MYLHSDISNFQAMVDQSYSKSLMISIHEQHSLQNVT